jgi:hypothetical protein
MSISSIASAHCLPHPVFPNAARAGMISSFSVAVFFQVFFMEV